MNILTNEFMFIKDNDRPIIEINLSGFVWKTIKFITIGSLFYLFHLVVEVGIVVYVLKFIGML